MSDGTELLSNGYLQAIWVTGLTAWMGYMGRMSKKRDDAIEANAKAVSTLELKVAENYATKQTVLALFQDATQQTKDAVARVEKSIDATNASVGKLDSKIDNMNTTINAAATSILTKLESKTT